MRNLALAALFALVACSAHQGVKPGTTSRGRLQAPTPGTIAALDRALAENGIVTAGFGLVKNGELAWSHYYGEQTPGVAAHAGTRFNAASITKTVAAEAALRLVAAGELTLDTPLAAYWVDPDIASDPRRDRLTVRMVLNHSSGFPNWRFFRPDRKLAFEHDPGTHYGYSGEGFEYLARAIERKLGEPFAAVVQRTVLDPVGMRDTVLAVHRQGLAGVARPVDDRGTFPGYYCRPEGWCRAEGETSAADDMLVTVPDYARFLVAVQRGSGYDAALARERDRVQTDRGAENPVNCQAVPSAECPTRQGYGLGFEVAEFGDWRVVGHGGSDWSEQSLAYFYQPSGDGLVIFLNAPNRRTMAAMPRILALLDPASPFAPRYRGWLAREIAQEAQ